MTSTIESNDTVFQQAGLGSAQQTDSGQETGNNLGQEDFLALLTTQLANQDPFNPMENEDFVAQMAQFSSLEGMNELNESFGELASSLSSNQALQASTLVGRNVMIGSDIVHFDGENNVGGRIMVEQGARTALLQITDATGQLINEVELGDLPPGEIPFTWDGSDVGQNTVNEGNYQLRVYANVNGEFQALPTEIQARVESVNIRQGASGITLNLSGLGAVALSEVSEVGE